MHHVNERTKIPRNAGENFMQKIDASRRHNKIRSTSRIVGRQSRDAINMELRNRTFVWYVF